MKSIILFSLTALFCGLAALHGQMLTLAAKRPQPEISWSGDALAVLENGNTLKVGDIPKGIYRAIPRSEGSLGVSFWKGTTTTLKMKNDAFFFMQSSGASRQEERSVMHDDDACGIPFCIYETDTPGLFFAINVSTGFVKDGEASCCAWYRKKDGGELYLDRVIPIEWNGPAFWGVRKDGKFIMAQLNPKKLGLAPFLDYPIRVPGAFVVASWRAGLLWIIRDGDLVPTKTIDLVSIDSKLVNGNKAYPPVILGIQPMRNGNILIARRSARAISVALDKPEPSRKVAAPLTESTTSDEKKQPIPPAYPEIEWAELDPVEGTLTQPTATLLGSAPTALKSEKDAMMFTFGLDLQEHLVCPWVSPTTTDSASKTDTEKQTGTKSKDNKSASKADTEKQTETKSKENKSESKADNKKQTETKSKENKGAQTPVKE